MSWQTQPEEGLRSISQVRELTGLSARTIRYYEELGLLPGVRRRAGGRRVYGADEIERLRFIHRLEALDEAQVKELNAVYAIAGSTHDMLDRLDDLLGRRLADLELRIGELSSLRDEIRSYQGHVRQRIVGLTEAVPRGGSAGSRGRPGSPGSGVRGRRSWRLAPVRPPGPCGPEPPVLGAIQFLAASACRWDTPTGIARSGCRRGTCPRSEPQCQAVVGRGSVRQWSYSSP